MVVSGGRLVLIGGRLWLWVVGDCGCEWWEIVVVSGERLWL